MGNSEQGKYLLESFDMGGLIFGKSYTTGLMKPPKILRRQSAKPLFKCLCKV